MMGVTFRTDLPSERTKGTVRPAEGPQAVSGDSESREASGDLKWQFE